MVRKALLVLALAALILPVSLFAAANPGWTSPGNLDVAVGLHYSGWGLGVGGGVEFMFLNIPIADVTSIQIGATARGYADLLASYWGTPAFGVGGMITAHWSPKTLNLNFSYLANIDFYIGLGLGVNIMPGYSSSLYYLGSAYNPNGLGIWQMEGVSYYFNPNLGVFAEYDYYGGGYTGNYGGTLGIQFKL
jgi:hypothetical protein